MAALGTIALAVSTPASAQERTVKITGFGAKSGVVRVFGVNSDASVRGLKGDARPLVPADQRAEVLAALDVVDRVVIFDEPTPEAALARLQPDVHTKGADYADRELPERAVVEGYGGSVELLPFVPGISTTELAARLRRAP